VRRTATRRWIGRVLLALGVPALLLEGTLQLATWIACRVAAREAPSVAAPHERSVLCVGDSYTFGIGASDERHAWPARLEERLRERTGRPWSVRNGGWPGRDSRDLLRELPSQLERSSPAWVCILVGTNDGWSRPELDLRDDWFAEAAGQGFRWEWRTRRLAALAWNAWRRGMPAAGAEPAAAARPAIAPEARPLIGAWLLDGRVVRLEESGRCWYAERERSWSARGDELEIAASGELPAVRARWRVEGRRIALRFDGSADANEAERTLLPARRRRTALDAGVAETLAAGRGADARARLDALRSAAAESPEAAARALAAQVAVERGAPSVALAQELLARFPEQVELLAVLAEQAHGAGDDATARVAVEQALALAPEDEPVVRADLHRTRALVLRRSDAARALASIAESYVRDGDRERAAAALRAQFADVEEGQWGATIAAAGLEPAARERLDSLARDAAGDAAVGTTLEAHLRQAVALCRSRGATPLLLSYPFRDRQQHPVFARFSADDELRRVSLHVEFERLLQDHAREEYFVADGHCNDAGYDVIARLVADALLAE